MREMYDEMEDAARLSASLAQTLIMEGYTAHGYPMKERPGAGIIVWQPDFSICEIVMFLKGRRWWWYRVIDHHRIRNRDHLLALSRVCATTMVWMRRHDMRWASTDLDGKDVRPLGEVQ